MPYDYLLNPYPAHGFRKVWFFLNRRGGFFNEWIFPMAVRQSDPAGNFPSGARDRFDILVRLPSRTGGIKSTCPHPGET
jgi:hypothetical protein